MRFTKKESGEVADKMNALIKALEFYADSRRYRGSNQKPLENDPYAKQDAVYIHDVLRDGGEIAKIALRTAVGSPREPL